MALSTSEKTALATKFATDATYVSLHTADPGTTGASEVTGGSPAYARKALTWAAASGGAVSTSAGVTLDVPGSTTITYVGFWTAATGGTWLGSQSITSETFAGQGTYTLSSVTYTQS